MRVKAIKQNESARGWWDATWPYALIASAFVADRLTKWWMADFFAANGNVRLNAWVTLRETYNRGVAFGLFPGVGTVVGWLSLLVLAAALLFLWQTPRSSWLERLGLALFVGGAAGNLWDRITTGQVLDFVELRLRVGIFNVADVCINLGVILLLLGMLVQQKTASRQQATENEKLSADYRPPTTVSTAPQSDQEQDGGGGPEGAA